MKKGFVALAFGIITVTAFSQEAVQPPAAVTSSFQSKFPGVEAAWKAVDTTFHASFSQNRSDKTIVLQHNGEVVETRSTILRRHVPRNLAQYVRKHYSGASLTSVVKVEKHKQKAIQYQVDDGNRTIYFDGEGNFLRATLD